MKKFRVILVVLLTGIGACSATLACTDIRIKAQDSTVLIGRSMEFALDFHSRIMSSPRGRTIANQTNDGQPASSWKNRYGYVFLDGLNTAMVIDGLNEQGLSIEALYLPGYAQYQTIPKGQARNAVPYLRFGDWVLGNFKTVAEVKQNVAKIFVFAQKIPQAKEVIFPLHFSIHDASGKSLVLEFVGGKLNIYDNTVGVVTNSPTYDWQMTNLRNYINLSSSTPKPVIDNGLTFAAVGQGAGMLGLPGDPTPPSRFVKMQVMLRTVSTPNNAAEAVNLAQHLLNNVDLPLGFIGKDYTQWAVFKDLSHRILYYRTYQDLTLRTVDLNKINLSTNAPMLSIPIQ